MIIIIFKLCIHKIYMMLWNANGQQGIMTVKQIKKSIISCRCLFCDKSTKKRLLVIQQKSLIQFNIINYSSHVRATLLVTWQASQLLDTLSCLGLGILCFTQQWLQSTRITIVSFWALYMPKRWWSEKMTIQYLIRKGKTIC